MADTALNIGINTPANLSGLNQTVQAINQVTQAQQRQAQTQQATGAAVNAILGSSVTQYFTLAGAIIAAKGALTGFAARAGNIKDLAEQLTLATDEVQELEKAFRGPGLGQSDFAGALLRIGQARRSAAEGNERLAATFAKVGLSMEMLNDPALRDIDLLKQLALVSDRLTGADRTTLTDLLGKRAPRMIAALRELQGIEIQPIPQESVDAIDRATKGIGNLAREVRDELTSAVGLLLAKVQTLLGLTVPPAQQFTQEESDQAEFRREQGRGVAPADMSAAARRYQAAEARRAELRAQAEAAQAASAQRSQDAIRAGEQLREAQREYARLEEERRNTPQTDWDRSPKKRDWQQAGLRVQGLRIIAEENNREAARQAGLVPGLRQQAEGPYDVLARQGQAAMFVNQREADLRLENARKVEAMELASLNTAEQRLRLEEKRKRLMEEIKAMPEGEAKQKKIAEAADAVGALGKLGQADKIAQPLAANEWERRGANFGGGNSVADQTLQVQRDMRRELAELKALVAPLPAALQRPVRAEIVEP